MAENAHGSTTSGVSDKNGRGSTTSEPSDKNGRGSTLSGVSGTPVCSLGSMVTEATPETTADRVHGSMLTEAPPECHDRQSLQTSPSELIEMPDPTSSLAPDQVIRLKQAFAVFDKDNGGTIEKDELREVLRSMGTIVPDQVLENMFNEIDADGNGVIDLVEFMTLMKAWSRFVTSLRQRLAGFWHHFLSCALASIITSAICIIVWSRMGWGSDCLDGLEDLGEGWLPTILLGAACSILFSLYLLDFFIPPHIPRRWLTLSKKDPGVGSCIFTTALALLFCGNLPLAVQDNPHRPLMMTLYLAPACIAFLGFRVKFYHKALQSSVKKHLQKDGTPLEIQLFYVVKDIAMQDDDHSFFRAAMYAFFLAGCLSCTIWLPWAIRNSVPDPSDDTTETSFIIWLGPVMSALTFFLFGTMLFVRVKAHSTYTSVGSLKRGDSFLSKMKQVATLKRSYSAKSIDRGVADDIGGAEVRRLKKIAVLKTALKIMIAVCLCVFGLLLVFSGLAFPDGPISNMIRDYLISYTLSFVIFVLLAFSRLMAEIHEGVKDTPTWKSMLKLLHTDWTRALLVSCIGPFIFALLLLSAVNERVRRLRGVRSSRDKESMGGGIQKGRISEFNYAASWMGCFTERIRRHVRRAIAWDLFSIGIKIHIVCTVLIVLFLCPLFFNILFAFVIDLLRGAETWFTVLLVLCVGILALLIPFVPTTTVYVFGGVVMAEKWMSLPSEYGDFWMGVLSCIVLSLLIKLLGRFLQHQCFGKILGRRLWVQQLCKLHTPFMRTVAIIMAEPGFCRLGKVCVLCGVPDWPMGVGAGILGVPLFQTLVGTIPILFFIVPCVMLGSFFLRKDENEGWQQAYVSAMLCIGVVNMVFQVLAAHSLQKTFGENVDELSKPCLHHMELHWLDHCSHELARARHPKWDEVPRLLSWLLALSSFTQVFVLQLFFWAWDSCFGIFEVTDNIDDLQWQGDEGVIGLIGYVCLGAVVASLVACLFMYRYMSHKHEAARLATLDKLHKEKESWMQHWREMAQQGEHLADNKNEEIGEEASSASSLPSLKAHKSIDSPEIRPPDIQCEEADLDPNVYIGREAQDVLVIPSENLHRPLDNAQKRLASAGPRTPLTPLSPKSTLRRVSFSCEPPRTPLS